MEDEPRMAALLKRGLEEDGYAVSVASNGTDALRQTGESTYDLIILDVMLPGLDGMEVCRRLRAGRTRVPVLILTARDTVDDRINALNAGADDYLTKPFSFAELCGRGRALIRQACPEQPSALRLPTHFSARRHTGAGAERPN